MESQTLAGTLQSSSEVTLKQVTFPEFFYSRSIEEINTQVFDAKSRYDIILGRDILRDIKLIIDFKEGCMRWEDKQVNMQPFPGISQKELPMAQQMFQDMIESELEAHKHDLLYTSHNEENHISEEDNEDMKQAIQAGYKSRTIRPSLYEGATIEDVISGCKHLSTQEQEALRNVLNNYKKLFSADLGLYKGEKVSLEVDPQAIPHRQRAYTVPICQRSTFKQELDRLVTLGVLEPTGRSEWIAGTFIIPKKIQG